MVDFGGFTAADFDAYEERKWASNRFNLERMRVREKLQALAARALRPELVARLGVELRVSHDHPTIFNHRRVDAQWAYYARSEAERKRLATIIDREHPLHVQVEDPAEHHHHAVLGFRVHWGGVEVLLAMHRHAWLDIRNFGARLAEPYEAAVFAERLAALPPGIAFELGPEGSPTSGLATEAVRDAVARFKGEWAPEWMRFAASFSRDDAAVAEPSFVERAAGLLQGLAAIHDYVTWRPDNDFIGVQKAIRTEKKAAKAQAGAQAGPIEPGCAVRITGGVFAGRQGDVLELDGKGSAKVMVGAVPVKVRVAELQRLA